MLPSMRAKKSGRIINMGSVAGRMGLPGSPAYISSKFALEGLTECLRYELEPFGIQATIIEPGVVKTPFFSSMKITEPKEPEYQKMMNHIMSGLQMMVSMGTDPGAVASVVVKALHDAEMLPRYHAGGRRGHVHGGKEQQNRHRVREIHEARGPFPVAMHA